MKRFYSCITILAVIAVSFFPATEPAVAQVLLAEDFEDYSGNPPWQNQEFGGEWSTTVPIGFGLTEQNPCEGQQSVRRSHSSSTTTYELVYAYQEVSDDNDIELSFDYKIVNTSNGQLVSGNWGQVDLWYATDGDQTSPNWQLISTIDQNSPNSDCETYTATIAGSNFTTGDNFAFRAEMLYNSGDYYVYIDNFFAVEQVDCIQPYGIGVDNITFDSADVSWDDLNNPAPADGWEITLTPDIDLSICGILVPNPCITDIAPSSPHSFTNLEDGQIYRVYIRAICDDTNGVESEWTGPYVFQTVAIGTDCNTPFPVNADPSNPVAGDLPFTHSSNMEVYDNSHSGSPGVGCGTGANVLDGYEVVYEYVSYDDDILTVTVTGLDFGSEAAVFIYEDCADIGTLCLEGDYSDGYTTTGDDLEVHSLFVEQGETYYIVVASPDETDYDIEIEGFDCATWETPDGGPDQTGPPPFVEYLFVSDPAYTEQALGDFSQTGTGVNETINGAVITWYEDNNGAPGNEITNPLDSILLDDGDCFWVTQTIGQCESPALNVCFEEFDCANLDITSIDDSDWACIEGDVTLQAQAGNNNNIYWYNAEVGGEIIGAGPSIQTPVIDQTTSYWAAEVFLGEGQISNQGNPGPTASNDIGTNDAGLAFEVNSAAMRLVDFQVYVTGNGSTMTVELQDGSGTQVSMPGNPAVVSVTPGSSANPSTNTISLNWDIPNGTYQIVKTSGPSMMYTPSASFNYALGTAGEITSGATSSGTSNSYYYFYNWTILGPAVLCESEREEAVAEVVDEITITVSSDDNIICTGDSTWLHAEADVPAGDPDPYNYTWTWNGGSDTGASIEVTPIEDTTYTVMGVDPVTGCESTNEITVEVIGIPGSLSMVPDGAEVCPGEVVPFSAGGLHYDFEELTSGWTTVNNSSSQSASPSVADWQQVNSPYVVSAGGGGPISSNDESRFFISNADLLGFGGQVETELISPSFNLVGVQNAELSFYHFYNHYQTHPTSARVEVNTGSGWNLLQTYTSIQGSNDDFTQVTLSLDDYTDHADVKIRFNFSGGWGWFWAVDNVTITRTYKNGLVYWTPNDGNLYYDEEGIVPYDGSATEEVYFHAPGQGGNYDYTATLTITSCGDVDETITVTVNETLPPVGDTEQELDYGLILADLDVTGTALTWYVEDENGDLVMVSINTPLEHGETYYVTQTENGCESEPLAITVSLVCPQPGDIEIQQVPVGGTVTAVVNWEEPQNTTGVAGYHIVVEDANGDPVFDDTLSVGNNQIYVPDLVFDQTYTAYVYSICDEESDFYSDPSEEVFVIDVVGTDDFAFEDFTFYPNPTRGPVYFENSLPIERIEVFSLTGQKVLEEAGAGTRVQADFSALASGAYLAKVTVEGGATQVIRIVKD